MATIETIMQDIPLSTDIATQTELDEGLSTLQKSISDLNNRKVKLNNNDALSGTLDIYLDNDFTVVWDDDESEPGMPENPDAVGRVSINKESLLSNYTELSTTLTLSTEIVEGLSNTVIPKLSTIADLVSAEVERVDDISSAMNTFTTQFVPLSDYQALETRVAALEARVSALEGN